jgi:hypothetical protein
MSLNAQRPQTSKGLKHLKHLKQLMSEHKHPKAMYLLSGLKHISLETVDIQRCPENAIENQYS